MTLTDIYQRHRWLIDAVLAALAGAVMGFGALYVGLEGFGSRISQVLIGGVGVAILVLVVRDVKRTLLVAVFVDMSTALDVHLTCNTDYYLASCGINVSLTVLALIILYVLWFIDSRKPGSSSGIRTARFGMIGRYGAGFVAAGVLSLIASRNLAFGTYQIWLNLSLFALFFYLANNIRSRDEMLFIVTVMFIGLFVQVTIMELRSFGILPQDTRALVLRRVVGTLQSPNAAGGYLAQSIVLMCACLAIPLPRRMKQLMIVVILVAMGNLVGSESRGGWTSFVIGILLVGSISLWKKWLPVKYLMIAILGVLILGSLFSGPILDRLTRDDKGSADSRGPLAEIAFNMIRANPVIGVGINNFGVVLYDYVEADQFGAWLHLVHNRWLLIWSETGTIGMAFYVAFYLTTIWQGWLIVRKGHPVYAPVALGIIASMLGAGGHMMVEIYKWRILQQIIWTDAALIVAMSRLQAQENAALLPAARAALTSILPGGKTV